MRFSRFILICLTIFRVSSVQGQLTAQFSADQTEGCAPIRVIFKDESTGGATDWRWDLGNGTIALHTQNPSTTYLLPGQYTVTLTAYNSQDSSQVTKTNYITVNPTPVVNFGGAPLKGCLPFPVQFRDSSVPGGSGSPTYQWDFGDGNISTTANPVHNYKTPGIFKVTLTVWNGAGCINSLSLPNYVTVLDSIRANFTINSPATCGLPVTYNFTDVSTGSGIVSRSWDFGDGSNSTVRNPSHIYTTAGVYQVSLLIRNSNGCQDSIVKSVSVGAGSNKADFTNPGSVCVGKTAVFTNTSSPADLVDSVRWSFGNGRTSTATNGATTYASAGTYTVRMAAWFGKCVDSVSKTVSVVTAPKAGFTGSPTRSCQPPLAVQFTNTSTGGGTVVQWNFGDGTTSTDVSPSHTYNTFGSYTVSFIMESASGCRDTLTQPGFVSVQKVSTVGIKGLPYEDCIPWTNTFGLEDSSLSVTSYQWNFGDGTTSTLANPSHTFTDTIEYNVSVVVTTADGCQDTIKSTVHGGFKPKADFLGFPKLVCPLDPVVFTNLSSDFSNSWTWDFGDGSTSTDKDPSHLYKDTGYMDVGLIASNNGCNDTLIIPKFLYVNPPIARIRDSSTCGNPFEVFLLDNSIGGKYWKWYINGTDSVESKDTRYVFKDTGTYQVTLYVEDSLCHHSVTQDILVIDEKADFVTVDSSSCGNSYTVFEAAGPRTHPAYISSYRWDFGDGQRATTSSNTISHAYKKAGRVTVSLIITDIKGCQDTISKQADIKLYGPTADFTPPSSVGCVGSVISFTDASSADTASPVVKWTWDFGDGTKKTYTEGPFTTTYSSSGVFNVTLTVEDAGGCSDSIRMRSAVRIYQPKAGFSAVDTLICSGTQVAFTDSSAGVQLKYAWDFGNGKTSKLASPKTRFDSLGYYDIQLIVTDSANCRDTLIKPQYIFVNNAQAAFTLTDSFTTCPPVLVGFKNNSQNNVLNHWDFGDDNVSSLDSPSHTYTTSGIFNVKLVVTGNGGCKDSVLKAVTIRGPYGDFSYAPLKGCPPLDVRFEAHAFNAKTITFDFSDGNSILTRDSVARYKYTLPGDYVPRLILDDDKGCKQAIQGLDTIHVIGAKAFIQELPQYQFCDRATINFVDSSVTAELIQTYKWNFGDGTQSTLQNPVHTYNKEGRFTVTLQVITQTGCASTDTLSQEVVITRSPQLIVGPDTAVCVPSAVQFKPLWPNQDTTQVTFTWEFGNGETANMFNPQPVTYTAPGSYPVTLIGTTLYGCSDTSSLTLTVNDTPRVSAGQPAFICLGASQTLTASGALRYQWNANNSLSCLNCASPVATPNTSQVYSVTGTDVNGCKASSSVAVDVKRPANVTVARGDTLCAGESIQLSASGTEQYAWSPATGLNNPSIADPVASPSVTTDYKVIGYDTLGCFKDSAVVRVVVYPIPQFNILEEKISGFSGTLVPLATTSSADVIQWRWSPSIGLSCTDCPQPTAKVGYPLTYTAVATNAGNCTAEDRINVSPVCDISNIYIPNTFSPNGDGNNDVFFPHGRGLSLVKSMRIFNRWGELMYERKDFAMNDPAAGWNGTYKGAALNPDVYVYMIQVLCDNNELFDLKGNVTLVR